MQTGSRPPAIYSKTSEEFWQKLLQGFTAPTQWSGIENYQLQATAYGTHALQLSAASTAALQKFAEIHQIPLRTIVYGAWALLLSRYSGENDVVFGELRVCEHSDLSSYSDLAISKFINILPLRISVPADQSLLPWLQQLQAEWTSIQPHAHVPLTAIQEGSNLTTLFESMVVFEDDELFTATDRYGQSVHELLDQSPYPLTLFAQVDSATNLIDFQVSYESSQFRSAAIKRLLGHLQTLLESFVVAPQQLLATLPLITEAERYQLLVEWNQTTVDYPDDKCIHQLFEEQVLRTPEAIALVFEQQHITYQELNQRANQLAHYLQARGVGPDVLVGILVERSIEMVVALLGILKAGGAYVPLDPAYPADRLSYMLSDSQMTVLVAQQALLAILPAPPAQVVCIDTDWPSIAQSNLHNPTSVVTPAHLAYVIYTSGSTGKPKGVLVLQGAAANMLNSLRSQPGLTAADIVLAVTTISFDIAVSELYLPLILGARVVLASRAVAADSESLAQLIEKSQATFMQATPATWHLLLAAGWSGSAVLKIISGGEALSFQLASELLPKVASLWNMYGPTEVTVWSTVREVTAADLRGSSQQAIPIGRPIANTQTYILDPHLKPAPIGISGELYIGGVQLARGYLNRPDLTVEKFIAHPFSNQPGARLYRTGDLARYLPNGDIEYISRIDNQVKIRGYRIELGEIEAVLATHPAVRQNVVLVREDLPGNKRLVAYLILADQQIISARELRYFLSQQLPIYMVPAAVVVIEAMPLTPSGKIDRRSLLSIECDNETNQDYIAPHTATEQIITNIFSEVLGVKNVGLNDNFFELGGHSLLATQLISRLRRTFEVEIPLAVVFSESTISQLDRHIQELQLQRQGFNLPTIKPRPADIQKIPLSFAQERLWFLNHLEGNAASYNIPSALRLNGDLNLVAFEKALTTIIHRHESLRTSFSEVGEMAQQVIHPEVIFQSELIDLQQLPECERESVLKEQLTQAKTRPFDLEQAPLLRVCLWQLWEQEYVCLINMHHIVSDGWSIGIIIQELVSLYSAYSEGTESPLPELAIQYADFALWQRQWLQGDVLDQQLEYWKSHLEGAPALLRLPTDRPRPSIQTYCGNTYSCNLPVKLTEQVQVLSRRTGNTLFMTLLAGFATLMYRYSGQSDIVIGSPIANRNRQEFESLIGFFVNTLVLRTNLEEQANFEQVIAQVKSNTLKAYENQDTPFQRIVEALQLERTLSHSPLFQVMFILQNAPMGELELPAIASSEVKHSNTTSKFDLTLSVSENPEGLACEWEYNTDLFDDQTIERMADHFTTLLSGLVGNPSQAVSEIPLLSNRERQQLLYEWNDTAADYPKDKHIHQLFEEQEKRTPDEIAVVFEEQSLTYRELNNRANQLAHYLQARGVGPDVLVGILVERSLEMIVGLLGILKAGGAYVPLDPAYPADRLSYMLSDSQMTVLVAQQALLAILPSHQAQVVCLDADWPSITQSSLHNPPSAVTPTDLAYVIYTSGSTGKPKGVQVLQGAATNFLSAMRSRPGLTAADIVLAVTTISFDIAVLELYLPLIVGAQVVLASRAVASDSASLEQLIEKSQATFMQATPATWHLLLAAGWSGNTALKIACGGEALSFQLASELLPKVASLWNMYGPTEATVWATVREVTAADLTGSAQQAIPIGRPIANTQTYILDPHLKPAPIGINGELYIGGVQLAKGYLNRPDLTAEKFIAHPFSDQPGARLYRTGDLARYLPNGDIEYISRIDNQVKIRGHRIELGEIEVVLATHPAVRQNAVVVREDLPGDKRLVAYLVLTDQQTITARELRYFLSQQLPIYMVPTTVVVLEAMPLTPNGKIDRRSLPVTTAEQALLDSDFVAPRNQLEESIAQIWQEVLGVEKVSIHDNFFEIGGNSLIAVRLLTKLGNAWGQNLPLTTFLQTQTIAQLAVLFDQKEISATWSSLVPIQPQGSKPPLFCIHPIGGNVLDYLPLAQHLGADQPVYGLQSLGLDGQQKFLTSVEDMASHYIEEMRTLQPEGPYSLAGHSFGATIALEVAQQLRDQDQEVGLLAFLDGTSPSLVNVRPSLFTFVKSQLSNLWQLSFREKLAYLKNRNIWQIGLAEKFSYLQKRLTGWQKNTKEELISLWSSDGELGQHLIDLLDNNLQAMNSYTATTYPGNAILLRCEIQDMESSFYPELGWEQLINGHLETCLVADSSHFDMMKEPNVQLVAKILQSYL